jgi:hypothetical protein
MVNEFTEENGPQIEPRDLTPGEMLESIDPSEIGSPITSAEPLKNIIFVGDGEPATAYHGAFKAELPDAEIQRRGFYHPQASKIIGQFPKKYKRFIRKGDK